MRRNHTRKQNRPLSSYDHVYIDIPQCPWLSDLVVDPLKTVYHNRAADINANIVRMIRIMDDLDSFLDQYRIDL